MSTQTLKNHRQNVTSISLVNKSNFDSDVQIADALAPIAGMVFSGIKPKNNVEKVKIKLIERKLADKLNPTYLESLV